MPISLPARRVIILLLALLLLAVTLGCSCGQILQEWFTQFLQDLTRAIELWIREQVARFLAHLQLLITDWWNGVLDDIKNGWDGFWGNVAQSWRDFWARIFPPSPVILEPADGLTATGGRLLVRGTALPNSTVTLFRGGVLHRIVQADSTGAWTAGDVELKTGDNIFTAMVRDKLFSSESSNSVRVTWAGAELFEAAVLSQ